MNNTVIVYLKSFIAFTVPALSALGAGLALYEKTNTTPTLIGWIIIGAATFGAGFVSLSSFLSRSYADHQDAKEVDAGTPQIVPAAVTAVAEPKPITPPNP